MTRHCIALILWLAACSPLRPAMYQSIPSKPPGTQTSRSPDKTAVRLSRTEDRHQATLLFHEKTGVLTLGIIVGPETRHALLPMAKRVELWKPLLEEFFEKYGRRKDYLVTVGLYPELGGRIAAAAACSGKWNPKTGQPLEGDAGSALKDLFSDNAIDQELFTFFDALGYRLSVESAESVMRCRWRLVKPDPVDPACHPKMRPEGFVPCRASIIYRLDAKE